LTYIPSFDERCRRISMAMFMNSKKIRNINDLNRYLADPKTDNILKQYAAEIKPRLIEKFTLEQFRL